MKKLVRLLILELKRENEMALKTDKSKKGVMNELMGGGKAPIVPVKKAAGGKCKNDAKSALNIFSPAKAPSKTFSKGGNCKLKGK